MLAASMEAPSYGASRLPFTIRHRPTLYVTKFAPCGWVSISWRQRGGRVDAHLKSSCAGDGVPSNPPSTAAMRSRCKPRIRSMIHSKAIRFSPQTRKGAFDLADKLVSHNFGRGTIGFKSVDDPIGDAIAVCILPGTELAFDEPI